MLNRIPRNARNQFLHVGKKSVIPLPEIKVRSFGLPASSIVTVTTEKLQLQNNYSDKFSSHYKL